MQAENAEYFKKFIEEYKGEPFEFNTGEIYYDDPTIIINQEEYRISVGFFLKKENEEF